MKLPNGEQAMVDIEKLVDYCLNPEHPRGKHKARVFLSACGLTAEHAEFLREQLIEAAAEGEAVPRPEIGRGRRYVIEWSITGPTGTTLVRSAWIIRTDEDFPRFVSAFVL
jgi:hypothetical protein